MNAKKGWKTAHPNHMNMYVETNGLFELLMQLTREERVNDQAGHRLETPLMAAKPQQLLLLIILHIQSLAAHDFKLSY